MPQTDNATHLLLQEKRSAYAPTTEEPVRYDGIYRIASCWRVAGAQGKLMCRYLFVRSDSEPAPWASDGELWRPMLTQPTANRTAMGGAISDSGCA